MPEGPFVAPGRSLFIQQFVEGCDLLRKSSLVRSVTMTARLDDLTELYPMLQEIADQAGVAIEMKGTGGSVALTLTPAARRPL
jgi:hypothetical protein